MPIRLAIAEDNYFLAQSIRKKMAALPDIECVGIAENGRELLALLEENPRVDVVLMDLEMPEVDGIVATAAVRERFPHIKVVILTVFDDHQKLFQAIQAGAHGYLLKEEPAEKIHDAIQMVLAGGAPMTPIMARKALELLRQPPREEEPSEPIALSPRQIEILEQLSQGLNYHQIAENLTIAPATVRKHMENIYKALHVNNKMQAVQKARKHRLI